MSVEEFEKAAEFRFALKSGETMRVPKDFMKPKTEFVSRSGEKGVMLHAEDIGIFVMM